MDIHKTFIVAYTATADSNGFTGSLQDQVRLVMTVPSIQRSSAIPIISEIGVDMSVFPTDKHLCSWAGVVPGDNQSAGKKKYPNHFWKHVYKGFNLRMCLGSCPNAWLLLVKVLLEN